MFSFSSSFFYLEKFGIWVFISCYFLGVLSVLYMSYEKFWGERETEVSECRLLRYAVFFFF